MRRRASRSDGFCLLELIIATTTLVVALSALAQLLSVAALATSRAGTMTRAAVLAQQKIEILFAQANGGAGIAASPSNTLTHNVDGYCDFVDAGGNVVGGGTTPPPTAVFLRRWSIERLETSAATLVLDVLVSDAKRPAAADDASAALPRLPGDARIVSVVRTAS